MKVLQTQNKQKQTELFNAIASRYKMLSANPRNQSSAIVCALKDEFGISQATIYKVVRLHNLYRSRIDRVKLINHHATLVSEGMKSSKAVLATALKFGCTREYVYQLIKIVTR